MSKTRQRINMWAAIISAIALGLLAAMPEDLTRHDTSGDVIADTGGEHAAPNARH